MIWGPLIKSPRINANSNAFVYRILNWQKSLNTCYFDPLLLLMISAPSIIKEPIKTSKKRVKSKLITT